jgi:hypothetical protein
MKEISRKFFVGVTCFLALIGIFSTLFLSSCSRRLNDLSIDKPSKVIPKKYSRDINKVELGSNLLQEDFSRLIKDLKSNNESIVLEAISDVYHLREEASVLLPYLIPLMKTNEDLLPVPPEFIPEELSKLVEGEVPLWHKGRNIRKEVMGLIIFIGKDAVPLLMKNLGKVTLKFNIAIVLSRICNKNNLHEYYNSIVPILVEIMATPEFEFWSCIDSELTAIGTDSNLTIPYLCNLLHNENRDVREKVIYTLTCMDSDARSSIPYLRKYIETEKVDWLRERASGIINKYE